MSENNCGAILQVLGEPTLKLRTGYVLGLFNQVGFRKLSWQRNFQERFSSFGLPTVRTVNLEASPTNADWASAQRSPSIDRIFQANSHCFIDKISKDKRQFVQIVNILDNRLNWPRRSETCKGDWNVWRCLRKWWQDSILAQPGAPSDNISNNSGWECLSVSCVRASLCNFLFCILFQLALWATVSSSASASFSAVPADFDCEPAQFPKKLWKCIPSVRRATTMKSQLGVTTSLYTSTKRPALPSLRAENMQILGMVRLSDSLAFVKSNQIQNATSGNICI